MLKFPNIIVPLNFNPHLYACAEQHSQTHGHCWAYTGMIFEKDCFFISSKKEKP